MDDIVILPQQTLTVVYTGSYGVPMDAFNFGEGMDAFALEAGETYTVRWDGVEYEVTALDMSAVLPGAVGLGNTAVVGGPNTGEPFALACTANGAQFFALDGIDRATHTVEIIQRGAGILLMDHAGTPVEHRWPRNLQVDTTDGGTALYVHESQIDEPVEKILELDFSGGDMVVTPEEGKAFSRVEIPVPEGLAPENIAEGVDIAGIIGAFAGTAGGAAKIATGSFTSNGGTAAKTIEHGLGVIPDIVIVRHPSPSSHPRLMCAVGVSSAFKAAYGFNCAVYATVDDYRLDTSVKNGIDELSTGPCIHNATETNFSVGGGTVGITLDQWFSYGWLAIGGLT